MAIHPVEEATIRAFVRSEKRDRFITLLGNPKRRRDAVNELNHFDGWDYRFGRSLDSDVDLLEVVQAATKHAAEISAAFPGIEVLALEGGLAPHLAGLAHTAASPETTGPAGELLPYYLRDPLTRGLLNSQPRAR